MKKTLFFLVALLTATIAFAYDVEIDGIYYNLNNENKTAEVTYGDNKYSDNITIPEKVTYNATEYSVTSIGRQAFSGCRSLTSITIPNSITSIGVRSFDGCSSLSDVYISDIVAWCNIDFYMYDSNPFYFYAENLYLNGNKVINLIIPEGVKIIKNCAFAGYDALVSVVLPNSLTYIGAQAFAACTSLTSITISENVTMIGMETFYGCSSLTSITIPNSVTTIESSAFSGCSSLTSITIPNSVTSIGNYAFSNTPWLNNQPDGCVYAGSCLYAYKGEMPENTHINVKEGTTQICYGAFAGCSSLTSITIPNSVTSIGNSAFYNCSSLTSITIPNSVTEIGGYAFESCSSLTSITIPNSVTSIGNNAFSYCLSLTSITIPDSVIYIENELFSGCYSLRYLKLGKSISHIRKNVFPIYYDDYGYPCSSIDTLICEFNDSVKFDIFDNSGSLLHPLAFMSNLRYFMGPSKMINTFSEQYQAYFPTKLMDIHIIDGELDENGFNFINRSNKSLHTIDLAGATNTTINDLAFYDCYKLENLTLPKNVETIGYKAFADCKHLTELIIPASVTEIGESAFENCRSINTLTFKEGSQLESIGSWAFYNNHNLLSVEIPEGVKTIGDAAFYGCTYLEDITLPSSVERIGDNGFALCNQVKRMEVRATTPPTIEAKTFHQVSRDIEFIVPAEARNAYAQDEFWHEFIQKVPTNTENIIEGIEIYTQNGTLHLEGLTAEYQIYNMSGQMVYSGNASTLDLAKGIYIIRINDKSQKIVL